MVTKRQEYTVLLLLAIVEFACTDQSWCIDLTQLPHYLSIAANN